MPVMNFVAGSMWTLNATTLNCLGSSVATGVAGNVASIWWFFGTLWSPKLHADKATQPAATTTARARMEQQTYHFVTGLAPSDFSAGNCRNDPRKTGTRASD